MMSTAKWLEPVSIAEYLAGERLGTIKHEYVAGSLYAMVGGRVQHNVIAANALIALGSQLRGQRCRPFNSDMKIRIELPTHTRFYYPDVSVVCESNGPEATYQDRPVVVIEVLSRSTYRTDTGEKKEGYLAIPSLKVYLLVEQETARVLVCRRSGEGFETERYLDRTAVIPLPEISASLSLADLYEAVEFSPEPDPDDDG